MAERSKYQDKIIRNYYRHQPELKLQRLSELVTELYLAQGKARAKYWQQAAAALEKLEVPANRIEQLVAKDQPELLAKLVQELSTRPAGPASGGPTRQAEKPARRAGD